MKKKIKSYYQTSFLIKIISKFFKTKLHKITSLLNFKILSYKRIIIHLYNVPSRENSMFHKFNFLRE